MERSQLNEAVKLLNGSGLIEGQIPFVGVTTEALKQTFVKMVNEIPRDKEGAIPEEVVVTFNAITEETHPTETEPVETVPPTTSEKKAKVKKPKAEKKKRITRAASIAMAFGHGISLTREEVIKKSNDLYVESGGKSNERQASLDVDYCTIFLETAGYLQKDADGRMSLV